MRAFVFFLLLFPFTAGAAISFVNSSTDTSASATSVTASEPTSTAQGDVVFLFCSIKTVDGTWTDPTDFTEIDQRTFNEGDTWHLYIGYKVRGATAGEALTCSYSGTAGPIQGTAFTYTGNDSTPLDVTFTASHVTSGNGDGGLGACPAITTNTNGAVVVCIQYFTDDGAFTAGAPTNYTLDVDAQAANRTHEIASRTITTATTETPGNWQHTDVVAGADSGYYTLAIKPATTGNNAATLRRRR